VDSIAFTASLDAIRGTRAWAVGWTAEHGFSDATQRLVALLTTELVTNAVRHGPRDGRVTVSASVAEGDVRFAVTDESPDQPRLLHVDGQASSGRGVMLVDRLSSAWGVERIDAATKSVWFRVGPR
jgi:anti-sigma regulatory factor (Ser/Thr protein kinase)